MTFTVPFTAQPVLFSDQEEMLITPSPTSSVADFDFLEGTHDVRHKKLQERMRGSTTWIDVDGTKTTRKILEGTGNIEEHRFNDFNGKPVAAAALRLFDVSTRLWSLYWADNIHGTLDPPLRGSFTADLGVFFGWDFYNGKQVLVQFQYDRSNADEPVWGQAFSSDRGATWEWNWVMYYRRVLSCKH